MARTARTTETCIALLAACCASACTPLVKDEPRFSQSTLGCVNETLRRKLPPGAADEQAHCLAAGLIARHCSVTEAMLASIGKEIGDLFGPGRAQWSDLRADRRGVRCARGTASEAEFFDCCEAPVRIEAPSGCASDPRALRPRMRSLQFTAGRAGPAPASTNRQ